MSYWEVIYETGAHSVLSVDDEDAAKSALSEQHRRAMQGEVGGPTGHPAERVVRVLEYDRHPAEEPRVDEPKPHDSIHTMTEQRDVPLDFLPKV